MGYVRDWSLQTYTCGCARIRRISGYSFHETFYLCARDHTYPSGHPHRLWNPKVEIRIRRLQEAKDLHLSALGVDNEPDMSYIEGRQGGHGENEQTEAEAQAEEYEEPEEDDEDPGSIRPL